MTPLDRTLDYWFKASFRAPVAAALATDTRAHSPHRHHPSNHTGHIVGIVLASIFVGVVALATLRALCSREGCCGRHPDSDDNDSDNDNVHGNASSSDSSLDVDVVTPALAHVPLHEDVVLPGAGGPRDVEEAGAAAGRPRWLRVGTFRVPFTRPGILRVHRNVADAGRDGWKTPPPPYELPPSYESPPGYEVFVAQPRSCVLAGRGGAGLGR